MKHTDLTNKKVDALFCKFVLGMTPEELREMAGGLPEKVAKSFRDLISETLNSNRRIVLSWLEFVKKTAEENKKRWQ